MGAAEGPQLLTWCRGHSAGHRPVPLCLLFIGSSAAVTTNAHKKSQNISTASPFGAPPLLSFYFSPTSPLLDAQVLLCLLPTYTLKQQPCLGGKVRCWGVLQAPT